MSKHPKKHSGSPEQAEAYKKGDKLRNFFAKLSQVNSNHIMALFTAGLFIASTLQWWLTRDTFRIGNRAYIGVKFAKIWQIGPVDPSTGRARVLTDEPHHEMTLGPVLEVGLVNTGMTPALDEYGWAASEVADKPCLANLTTLCTQKGRAHLIL